jgi:ABC-type phosphate transport system substrate-binding protein
MARVYFFLALAAVLVLFDVRAESQTRAAPTAPFVVIVHRSNALRTASRTFVADAFLKRTTRWPDGETIRPVDQRNASAVRARFTESVLRRPIAAVRSYWQQVIFTGRGVPPPELDDDREVLRYVSTHVGAIGYVSGSVDLGTAAALTVQ